MTLSFTGTGTGRLCWDWEIYSVWCWDCCSGCWWDNAGAVAAAGVLLAAGVLFAAGVLLAAAIRFLQLG